MSLRAVDHLDFSIFSCGFCSPDEGSESIGFSKHSWAYDKDGHVGHNGIWNKGLLAELPP